ncbi:hypothetical protein F4820DRAFT_441963 [Hypoxylon rubiginosum]|uniref:Uncharacterized protein n=1 Tax=Hypoxylon rubiginosum TaxID=110542 RepID=A0ACB9YII8_9PEZI|nr:hypothetical protein F4820DRAFT_441963 [Hypoxylon rubiginosum]
MEVAGLIVGGVSLAGIFTACVDCFEYVQFGRQFGRNYQTAILKLDLIKLRLCRWADAVSTPSKHASVGSEAEAAKVKEVLGQIIYLFEETERTSKKFKTSEGRTDTHSVADLDADIESIHLKMKNLALKRQKRSSFTPKASWALFEEKYFNRLIEDVDPLVRDLVEMFPAAKEEQQKLSVEEAQQLQNEQGIATLQDANDGQDDLLRESIAQALASKGRHRFVGNVTKGDIRVTFGNTFDGMLPITTGAGSLYKNNEASGNAIVHYGNHYYG